MRSPSLSPESESSLPEYGLRLEREEVLPSVRPLEPGCPSVPLLELEPGEGVTGGRVGGVDDVGPPVASTTGVWGDAGGGWVLEGACRTAPPGRAGGHMVTGEEVVALGSEEDRRFDRRRLACAGAELIGTAPERLWSAADAKLEACDRARRPPKSPPGRGITPSIGRKVHSD